jgi:hypothetical protein
VTLPIPDHGDGFSTREMAEQDHVRDDDRVRLSGMIWLAVVGLVLVLALAMRAAF